MNNIAIIVQARLKSTRFPKKVMLEVGSSRMTVLEHVLKACIGTKDTDVFLVVPDNEVGHFQKVLNARNNYREYYSVVSIVGGDEQDVLGRCYGALDTLGYKAIVRITSDCPLLKPEMIEACIKFYYDNDYEYISNTTIKHGLSKDEIDDLSSDTLLFDGVNIEVFSMGALAVANYYAKDDYDREHVTPFMKRELSCGLYDKGILFLNGKLSLDEYADIDKIDNILELYEAGVIKYGEFDK